MQTVRPIRYRSPLLIISFLLAPNIALGTSLEVEWLHQIRSPRKAYEVGTGVSLDRLGNVFITGWTDGLLGSSQYGGSDAFISKYDSAGNLLWTEQLGTSTSDYSFAASTDGLGNVFITGSTSGDLSGTHSGGGSDVFLSKYDGNGNLLWVEQFGSGKSDSSKGLTVDSFGNAYIIGSTLGSIDGVTQPASATDSNAFVSKFGPNGAQLWTKQFGTADAEGGAGISTDASGHVYVSGQTTGDLGGANAGRFDPFVAKLDADGNEVWTRQFGTRRDDYNTSVASDGAGNVYVAGYTEGDLVGRNAGDEDIFLVKYNEDGVLQWSRQFGTSSVDQGLGLATDSLGNAYVSGVTGGDLGAVNVGFGDAFVSKFDSNGTLLWTEQFGTNESDAASGVSVDALGNVYLTGTTDDIFNPSFPDLFRESFLDAFVVKFNNPVPEPSTFFLGLVGSMCPMIGRFAWKYRLANEPA